MSEIAAPRSSSRSRSLKGGGRNRSGQTNFELYSWLFMRLSGLAAGIAPAGEMWSVVTESPTDTSTRALTTSAIAAGRSAEKFWKKGGSCTYVEFGSH